MRIPLAITAALALGAGACSGVNYSKPKPLNYDEMGLETHHKGIMGSPEVGTPLEEERIGHDRLEKLRAKKDGTGSPATAAPTAAPSTAAAVPPVPTVTGDPATVDFTGKSDLSAEAAGETLDGADGAVKGCYETALASTPALAGTVAVKLLVGNDGKVRKAEVASSTIGHPGTEACIVAAVKGLAFPKSKGGGSATIVKSWSLRLAPPK